MVGSRSGALLSADTLELDDRDMAILLHRAQLVNERPGVNVGDWVEFADGETRRVSHVWDWPEDESGPAIYSIQTSKGGSFYLGEGHVSFSGSLFIGVPGETFSPAGELLRDAPCWIFHHDEKRAHNGVDVLCPFRVWSCSLPSRSI